MSTTSAPRTARLGLVGGALWALLPVAWTVADPDQTEFGSLSFVAVAGSLWICMVAAPALLLFGISALRRALGTAAGRIGAVGLVTAAAGYGAMAVGNGIEVASLSAGGGEVDIGHAIFFIGFLISVVGGITTGIVVFLRRRDRLSRTASLLLALALPLGIGIGVLGSTLDPDNDAWFWAAIAVPTGIAWVLLGTSLRSVREPAPGPEYAAIS